CDGGKIRLTDFMPIEPGRHSVVRIVEGLEGSVPVDVTLSVRFGYGAYSPWIIKPDEDIEMIAAPDAVVLRTGAPVDFDEKDVRGHMTVSKGERVAFELTWYPSREPPP